MDFEVRRFEFALFKLKKKRFIDIVKTNCNQQTPHVRAIDNIYNSENMLMTE